MKAFFVKRNVTQQECPWLDNDIPAGTQVYEYTGHTYGVISSKGTAVTMQPGLPFFELPTNALEFDLFNSD